MKIMDVDAAAKWLLESGLSSATPCAVEKPATPGPDGRWGLPFFKLTDGRTARLLTTDEALEAHLRVLADTALTEVHGTAGILAKFLQGSSVNQGASEENQGVNKDHILGRKPRKPQDK